ncbi:DUF7282 domain-containing protein [Cesiribacter andamanensis]|uniref:DUF7282 domain-containing protein n=1 Tax=Cesiribacter andamanensis AMV16 TaxID=1279009 RepID=M7N6X9_9BACT|nr:hypothetical protein [Cesiribacter andamanensis]EMR02991.1 hypothetical protein ADICEAN_01898 [Cesiribacter andamanensis AMV16]
MLRKHITRTFLAGGLLLSSALFSSCKDDDAPEMMMEPGGSLQVADQMLSANTIRVDAISMDKAGWVVVHKASAAGGPVVPDIISIPKQLPAGSSMDVAIMLREDVSLQEGETLWVMLHTDAGVMGTYEFDASTSVDAPLTDAQGNMVMQSIEVMSAAIIAQDQPISNNSVVIDEVRATVDGWLVIHNDNGMGEPVIPAIIGKTWVEAGTTTNVVVELDETNLQPGQKLFPMLHVDSPADGEYTFPENGDAPEVFGQNIIMVNFTVEEMP